MYLAIMTVSSSQLLACNGEFTIVAISDEHGAFRGSDEDLGIVNVVTFDFCNMIQYQRGTFFQLVYIKRVTIDNLFIDVCVRERVCDLLCRNDDVRPVFVRDRPCSRSFRISKAIDNASSIPSSF